MILWTLQHPAVWEQLEREGVYAVSADRIGFPEANDNAWNHSHHAYQWLAAQMKQRVGPSPDGVQFPVWAWYKQQGRPDGKPDMREYGYYDDRPCVRMKLDVPDWEVLLTDFDDWHHALNYSYLPSDEADSERFDAWIESLGVVWRDISDWSKRGPEYDVVRAEVEASWERMIGVRHVDERWHLPWKKRCIQATFWVLRREYVLSAERFGLR